MAEGMKAPKRGDDVAYDWQGATVRGRVVEVVTSGSPSDSSGEVSMDASEDNPVYRVRLVDDDGEDTDTVVLRREDSLSAQGDAGYDDDEDKQKMHGRLTQSEVNYTPDYSGDEGRCASCRWFMANADACYLVEDYPDPILPTGRCDRQELSPSDEGDPGADMSGVSDETDVAMSDDEPDMDRREAGPLKAMHNVWQSVKNVFTPKPASSGLKVAGNTWLAVWSNNFEDRDGEWFSAKALDDYVYRVDHGLTPPPELWVWHIPETKIGQAKWVARHGHFMLASGTFDDAPHAQQAKAYYAQNPEKTSLSHGFTFDPDQFKDGVYNQFNTFEITLLPRGAEANRFTSLEGVKQMALSEEKRRDLERVFGGKEAVDELLADYDKAGKALEELGAAYKEFTSDPRESGSETEAVKTATDNADATFTALFKDMMGDHAEVLEQTATMAKEVNAVRKTVSEKLDKMAGEIDALRDEMQLRPRSASKSDETLLDEDSDRAKDIKEDVKRQTTKVDPYWGTMVSDLEEGE